IPWRWNLPCKNSFTALSFYRLPSFYGIPQLLRNSKRGFMRCTTAQVDQRREICTTILVIEDEGFVRDVTCQILRDADYRVLQADCAEAARKVFQRCGERIRLLLCDAVLPDSTGVVLAQTLCRLSAGLKVILASGYPRGALRVLITKTGRCSWPSLMVQFL